MRKKFFMLSIALLLLPFIVEAEPGGISINPQCPTIGQKPAYIESTQYTSEFQELWVNDTDYKAMDTNDVFEIGKEYSYHYGLRLKTEYSNMLVTSYNEDYNEDCPYVLGATQGGEDYISGHIAYYMGNRNDYEWEEKEKAILDINSPVLGGKAPYARSNSRYSILSEKWINTTDNKEMETNDVFEANKKYKYIVTYSTFYSDNNIFNNFSSNQYYLGQNISTPVNITQSTATAYFYFGDKSTLVIDGNVTISNVDSPKEGEVLSIPQLTIDAPTQYAYAYWYKEVKNGDDYSYIPVASNEVAQVGETYRYMLNITLEPGYNFSEDFEVINNNKNNNFMNESTSIYGEYNNPNNTRNYLSYEATYQVLESGQTIILKRSFDGIIYPGAMINLEVYPDNEYNQAITWTSSNESVAIINDTQEWGNLFAIAPGTTIITATNSNGDSDSVEIIVGVPAESIILNKTKLTLYVGDSETLNTTILPNNIIDNSVNWDIVYEAGIDWDNLPIEYPTNGVITAIRPGTIKVQATANAGGASAICKVTVLPYVEETEVSLDKTDITIDVDQNINLTATVTPSNATNKTITWTSDNENVATVDQNGNVSGVGVGNATITATTNNGKTATCEVTVNEVEILATEISLNKSVTSIYEGDTEILTATVLPNNATDKSITWTSSDEEIATVEDGVVTAINAGTATITATTANDLTDTCEVTVIAPEIAVTEITLNQTELTLEESEKVTLSATITPENATNKSVIWTSSNNNVATVEDGVVTAIGAGTATITATTHNGKTAQATVTVKKYYLVTFYDTDDRVLKESETYEAGTNASEIEKPLGLTNGNQVVDGWYLDKELTQLYDFTGVINSNINLYAKWKEVESLSLSATPTEISFGTQPVGFTNNVSKQVTIKNTGNTAVKLSISNPVSSGPFGSISFENNKELNPNEEYVVELAVISGRLYSDQAGTYNGSYVITRTSNSNATTTVTINATVKLVEQSNQAVSYTTHVQDIGWQKYVSDGEMAGTSGKSLRLEAIKIKLENQEYEGNIEYRTHIQNIGWESGFKKNNEVSGTSGRSLRLEAIEIKLTGEMAEHYDVYYRVHAQEFGWLGWAKNGEDAGSAGYSYRLEGIEIRLVSKDEEFTEYGKQDAFRGKIMYTTHVQNIGWQKYVMDGQRAGTTGKSLRLEAIRIKSNISYYKGSVEYRTHIQNIGWESKFRRNDELSGTSGRSLRLEAIEIRLTEELEEHYDIYYRVHAQEFGWLNWAKNGEPSGTAGFGYRLEGIEIVMVNKGKPAPVRTNTNNQKAFIQK